MPVVTCGPCQARYKVADSSQGKRVKCPKCQAVIEVPAVAGAPAAAAPPSPAPPSAARPAPPSAARPAPPPAAKPAPAVQATPRPAPVGAAAASPVPSAARPSDPAPPTGTSPAAASPGSSPEPGPTQAPPPETDRGPTRITYLGGKLKGQSLTLTDGVLFGRDPSCTVTLSDGSLKQALIKQLENGWLFRDLGGKNAVPILVNDQRLVEKVLRDKDRVRIGPMMFQFIQGNDPAFSRDAPKAATPPEPAAKPAAAAASAPERPAPSPAAVQAAAGEVAHTGVPIALLRRAMQALVECKTTAESLGQLAAVTLEMCPRAERVVLAVTDSGGRHFAATPAVARTASGAPTQEIPPSTILRRVAESRKTYFTAGAKEKQIFDILTETSTGTQAVICSPVLYRGELLGALYLDNHNDGSAFGQEDVLRVEDLAARFGVAMQESRMESRIARHQQREALFSRYVSVDLVERLESAGRSFQSRGELKKLTVLFTDIRNFTAMSENMEPQKLIAMMNKYFETMVDAINRYDGYVNKFIGDSIMAFWGAPEAKPMDTLQAVKAAMMMQRNLYFLNQDRAREGLPPMYMGVGIHTGNAVVGNVGSAERKEYSALGDTVNTASRIQSLTKNEFQIWETAYRIFLSEEVYGEVKGQIKAEPLPPQTVKGKAQAIQVFSVQGVLQAAQDEDRRRSAAYPYSGLLKVVAASGAMQLEGSGEGLSRVGVSGMFKQSLPVGA
ncbi:MAG: GAF domain-containing protein, partial [Candidatus Riflebacteria bacterium]|nr:GAF domain-containing protein [Candidatus Riflebacteria bacterium]